MHAHGHARGPRQTLSRAVTHHIILFRVVWEGFGVVGSVGLGCEAYPRASDSDSYPVG